MLSPKRNKLNQLLAFCLYVTMLIGGRMSKKTNRLKQFNIQLENRIQESIRFKGVRENRIKEMKSSHEIRRNKTKDKINNYSK